MRTYTELFGAREFTPLFVTASVQIAAQTVTGLALGTLIYTATRSPLLAALAMFGPGRRGRRRCCPRPTGCRHGPR